MLFLITSQSIRFSSNSISSNDFIKSVFIASLFEFLRFSLLFYFKSKLKYLRLCPIFESKILGPICVQDFFSQTALMCLIDFIQCHHETKPLIKFLYFIRVAGLEPAILK